MTGTAREEPAQDEPGQAADAHRALRDALAAWATGVAVATTLDATGAPVGMTINSFAAVSLDPPLVLWSARHGVPPFDAFEVATHFAVHVLAEDQQALSDRFAQVGDAKFAGLDWRPGREGLPLLDGSLARLECRVVHRYPGGDHLILVGEVLGLERREGRPLLFHGGAYRSLPG